MLIYSKSCLCHPPQIALPPAHPPTASEKNKFVTINSNLIIDILSKKRTNYCTVDVSLLYESGKN